MFSQYFGHYLLNKNLLSPKQLERALELQKSAHVKLGVLSVNAGYMNVAQVEETHQKQMQLDKRFGEIAIELGYLTNEQLEELLSSQKYSHLLLGQVLIDEGMMTLEQFSAALQSYKDEHSLSDEQFEAIQEGDINVLVNTLLPIDSNENIQMYKEYISLFSKNMIRFIDEQIRIEIDSSTESLTNNWIIYQEISGERQLFTAIIADDESLVDLAKKYSQEDISEPDELAQASLSEFLNLHNGIFLVNMSNRGTELDMNPQKIVQGGEIANLTNGFVVSVHLPSTEFKLVLATTTPQIIERD